MGRKRVAGRAQVTRSHVPVAPRRRSDEHHDRSSEPASDVPVTSPEERARVTVRATAWTESCSLGRMTRYTCWPTVARQSCNTELPEHAPPATPTPLRRMHMRSLLFLRAGTALRIAPLASILTLACSEPAPPTDAPITFEVPDSGLPDTPAEDERRTRATASAPISPCSPSVRRRCLQNACRRARARRRRRSSDAATLLARTRHTPRIRRHRLASAPATGSTPSTAATP